MRKLKFVFCYDNSIHKSLTHWNISSSFVHRSEATVDHIIYNNQDENTTSDIESIHFEEFDNTAVLSFLTQFFVTGKTIPWNGL